MSDQRLAAGMLTGGTLLAMALPAAAQRDTGQRVQATRLAPRVSLQVTPASPAQALEPVRLTARVTGARVRASELRYRFCVSASTTELACSGPASPAAQWIWTPTLPDALHGPASSRKRLQVTVQIPVPGRAEPEVVTTTIENYDVVSDAMSRPNFELISAVIASPRCTNCHARGDGPTVGDDRHPHSPAVTRTTNCTDCHQQRNDTATAHSPPGAPDWRMPPAAMPRIFANKSPAVLCAQLKDPTRNGGLDAQGLNHHALHDDKLKWGWAPGPGRTPAPYSWGSFHVAMADWLIYGATCPPIRLERRAGAPRPPA